MSDNLKWRQVEKRRIFLAAVEICETSSHPAACGMSRKLAELAEYVDHGGKVGNGALFVTSERGSNHTWLDWAIDFFSCLPKGAADRATVISEYGEKRDYIASRDKLVRRFWRRVKRRGLVSAGKSIAAKMA